VQVTRIAKHPRLKGFVVQAPGMFHSCDRFQIQNGNFQSANDFIKHFFGENFIAVSCKLDRFIIVNIFFLQWSAIVVIMGEREQNHTKSFVKSIPVANVVIPFV
jgi:hypothetical protein